VSISEIVAEFPDQVRPLRRDEYDRLVDLGVYEDRPIELLEGALVEMSPEGPPHGGIIEMLNAVLSRGIDEGRRVRVGSGYAAGAFSEPEPDLAVVDAPTRWPRKEHPSSAHLVIEVSCSSRRKDLGRKARIYAANGVPEYWVVDLAEQVVHVHTDPRPDGYRHVARASREHVLDACGVDVPVRDLFPEP
jgi:Uma2 family endonuclease